MAMQNRLPAYSQPLASLLPYNQPPGRRSWNVYSNYSVTGLFSIAFSLASLSMPSSLLTVGTASAWPPA